MPVPLALAAPAAVAGGAYFNARFGLHYDYRVLGSSLYWSAKLTLLGKRGRISMWYMLEDMALSKKGTKTFIIFEGRSWSYKEVYETSLKYGTWLKRKYDIKSKELVAIDMTNCEKFIFIWLGLWAIGAKPAFINYNLKGKALTHCVRVASTRLVLVDSELQEIITSEVREDLPGAHFEIFTPELEAEVMAMAWKREADSCRTETKPSDMAMLIYTSGTTGLPKGAIVSWSKIIVGGGLVGPWMDVTSRDVFYTCMPLYHSAAALLGFGTILVAGATLSLGKRFSTKVFWQEVRSTKATIIQYVGETCRYLLSAPPQFDPKTGENLDKKNSVRVAFGNGLRPDIWDKFKERFAIEAIAEFYSATEGPMGVWNYSRNNFSRGAVGRFGSIATAFVSQSLLIVKSDWETELPYRDPRTGFCVGMPRGQIGELLCKLDPADIESKFQGYYNNASGTGSKIIRDVLVKGDAYFRTGDMMSWDKEGRFYFSDRIGDTFRWKSENVSTSEVSEALGLHPLVQEANVYGVQLPHHDGRAGCVAILFGEEPSERLMHDLARHAMEKLPKFAVPQFLRLTKDMEITGTNKQLKHIIRSQGVDPEKVGGEEIYWLKDGVYRRFERKDWEELNAGRVRL